MRVKDKVAIVTGAASGIGRQTAVLFAREGARVIACDTNADGGDETAEMIRRAHGDGIFIKTDVADEDQVSAMVTQGVSRYGKLDILCNCAGIGPPPFVKATELSLDRFDRVMRVNVHGVFLCCKHAIPHMIENGSGSIINVASIAGLQGGMVVPITDYGTSKAAVLGLTKQLAAQFARDGIRVNAILPGPTDTPILDPLMSPEARRRYEERIPLGRMGQPEDQAYLCLYLACDESSFMTGSLIINDGGVTTT